MVVLGRDLLLFQNYFTDQSGECRLNILGLLDRNLIEGHTVLVGQLLAFLVLDLPSVFQVRLATHQDPPNAALLRVLAEFHHPGVDRVERITVGDVVNEDCTMRPPIKYVAHSLESFLTHRVPHLQLANFIIDVLKAGFEVDADSTAVILI